MSFEPVTLAETLSNCGFVMEKSPKTPFDKLCSAQNEMIPVSVSFLLLKCLKHMDY